MPVGDRGRFRVSFWTEGRSFSFHLSMQALFSREKPDLIVNLPQSSRQWGIWNGKAHLIPDPIEAIRTYNG